MALTPRGIWTPDSGEEYNFTVDAATTASTVDAALQKAANYGLGTQAEMNAAVNDFPNGALWFNTTNDTEYRRVSGAWVAQDEDDTGWVNMSTTSAFVSGTARVRRIGSTVHFSVTGSVNIDANTTTDICTVPTGFRPTTSISANPTWTAGQVDYGLLTSGGVLRVRKPTAGTNTGVAIDVSYLLD